MPTQEQPPPTNDAGRRRGARAAAGRARSAGSRRARPRAAGPRGQPRPLHLLLPKLGLVSEREVAETLAQLLDLPLAGEADYPDLPPRRPDQRQFLKEARILPLADTADGLTVAMADPLDRYTISAMQLFAGKPVLPWVGVPADIEAALERLFGRSGTTGEIIQPVGEQADLGAEDDVNGCAIWRARRRSCGSSTG